MKYVKTFESFSLNENQDIDFSRLCSEEPDSFRLELSDEGIELTREQEDLVSEFSKLEEECVKKSTSGQYSKVVATPSYNRRIEILKRLGVTDTSEFEERWKAFDQDEEIKCGVYYVEPNTDSYYPLRGNAFYSQPMIDYCISNNIYRLLLYINNNIYRLLL